MEGNVDLSIGGERKGTRDSLPSYKLKAVVGYDPERPSGPPITLIKTGNTTTNHEQSAHEHGISDCPRRVPANGTFLMSGSCHSTSSPSAFKND